MANRVTKVEMPGSVQSGASVLVTVSYTSASDDPIAIVPDPGFTAVPPSAPAHAADGGVTSFLLTITNGGATAPCDIAFSLPGTDPFLARVTVTT